MAAEDHEPPEDLSYLSFSPAVRQLLADNGIGLDEFLSRAGAANLEKVPDPSATPGSRAEPVTMIVASAAIIASVTPLLIQLLRTITHRPILATNRELVPVLDGKGDIIKDEAGKPVLTWRETSQLLEPSQSAQPGPNVTIKGFGLELTIGG